MEDLNYLHSHYENWPNQLSRIKNSQINRTFEVALYQFNQGEVDDLTAQLNKSEILLTKISCLEDFNIKYDYLIWKNPNKLEIKKYVNDHEYKKSNILTYKNTNESGLFNFFKIKHIAQYLIENSNPHTLNANGILDYKKTINLDSNIDLVREYADMPSKSMKILKNKLDKITSINLPILIFSFKMADHLEIAKYYHYLKYKEMSSAYLIDSKKLQESDLTLKNLKEKIRCNKVKTLIINEIENLNRSLVETLNTFLEALNNIQIICTTKISEESLYDYFSSFPEILERVDYVRIKIPKFMERKNDLVHLINIALNRKNNKSSYKINMQDFNKFQWKIKDHSYENLDNCINNLLKNNRLEFLASDIKDSKDSLKEDLNNFVDRITNEEKIEIKDLVTSFEQSIIKKILTEYNGNKNKTSKRLNINRTTLIEKIKKFES